MAERPETPPQPAARHLKQCQRCHLTKGLLVESDLCDRCLRATGQVAGDGPSTPAADPHAECVSREHHVQSHQAVFDAVAEEIDALRSSLDEAERRNEELSLALIEARNPGIDMERVKRERGEA